MWPCHIDRLAMRLRATRCPARTAPPTRRTHPPHALPPSTTPATDAASLAQCAAVEEVGFGTSTTHTLRGRVGGDSTPPPPVDTDAGTPPCARLLAAAFLPRGHPESVTPDYVPYQLAALPVHVAGWLSSSLATTALLAAVTASSSSPSPTTLAAGAAAATAVTAGPSAAVQWISKDGIGAAGRLVVGSSLGALIDDDPRRWRMVVEALTTACLALEIGTAAAPRAFLVLAGAAALLRAAARGVARPAGRVIQTHFCGPTRHRNVGDVAAREEVWEVAGQLVGLAAAVGVLGRVRGVADGPASLAAAWGAAQAAHIALRMRALCTLRFRTLNHKRAAAAVASFAAARGVPSIEAANAAEPLLASASAVRPRAVLGATVAASVRAWGEGGGAGGLAGLLASARPGARTVLARGDDGVVQVLVTVGAGAEDGLRALLAAALLEREVGAEGPASPPALAAAAAAADADWDEFAAALDGAGWERDAASGRGGGGTDHGGGARAAGGVDVRVCVVGLSPPLHFFLMAAMVPVTTEVTPACLPEKKERRPLEESHARAARHQHQNEAGVSVRERCTNASLKARPSLWLREVTRVTHSDVWVRVSRIFGRASHHSRRFGVSFASPPLRRLLRVAAASASPSRRRRFGVSFASPPLRRLLRVAAASAQLERPPSARPLHSRFGLPPNSNRHP